MHTNPKRKRGRPSLTLRVSVAQTISARLPKRGDMELITTKDIYKTYFLGEVDVPVLKAVCHLPVIVDPSHAAGVRALVPVLARAGVVVGADGLLVEVHPHPDKAASDGEQSLTFAQFGSMMLDLEPYLSLRPNADRLYAAAGGFD